MPAAIQPAIRLAGRVMACQFVRRYQARAGVTISPAELRWHQGVVSLRVLADVAAWIHDSAIGDHASHPWLVVDKHAAARLSALTRIAVRPR